MEIILYIFLWAIAIYFVLGVVVYIKYRKLIIDMYQFDQTDIKEIIFEFLLWPIVLLAVLESVNQ